MHLGYHELRNMLQKFREDREKRKTMAPPPSASGPTAASGGGFRDSRDRDRGGDRGYDRHRYEYVFAFLPFLPENPY